MKKIIVFLLMTAVVFSAAAGGKKENKDLREINVSYVKSPFNLPSIVAKNRGMLEEAFSAEGIKVNFFEINSGAKQSEAMAAGSLDIGGVVNTTSVILANANGNNVEIVSGYSRPVEVFALVVNKDIKSCERSQRKENRRPQRNSSSSDACFSS